MLHYLIGMQAEDEAWGKMSNAEKVAELQADNEELRRRLQTNRAEEPLAVKQAIERIGSMLEQDTQRRINRELKKRKIVNKTTKLGILSS